MEDIKLDLIGPPLFYVIGIIWDFMALIFQCNTFIQNV